MVAKGSFDSIVSLGANCAPARAIRMHFENGTAFPFDWWICSLDQLIAAVEGRFEAMFEPDEIETYKVVDWSVRSRRYGIAYHHDFTRAGEGYDHADLLAQLPAVAEKYARRFRRLNERVREGRTLFIRYGIDCAGHDQASSVPALSRLAAGLRVMWPEADFDLLALAAEEPVAADTETPDSVTLDWLGPPTGEMWREEQFFDLFTRRALSLRSAADAQCAIHCAPVQTTGTRLDPPPATAML